MQNESDALLLTLLSSVGDWLAESTFSVLAINVQVVAETGTVNISLSVNQKGNE